MPESLTSNAQSPRIIASTSNSKPDISSLSKREKTQVTTSQSNSILVSNASQLPTTSQTLPQQLQKPLTVMAKDPKTGVVRPLTLYPKNILRQPGGITTIQIGQNPANQIRLASPLVNKAPHVSSAVRRPVLLPKATIDDDHGLICKDDCKCAIMNVSAFTYTVRNLHILSKNSTLIFRDNC